MKNQTLQLYFLFIVLSASVSTVNAQWMPTNGPYGGSPSAILAKGNQLYAGTLNGNFFRSTDDGSSWTQSNSGLAGGGVYCLLENGTDVLMGTQGNGVYISSDGGMNWSASNTGINYPYVTDLVKAGSAILAAVGTGVHRSTDNGATWSLIDSGMTNTQAQALAVQGTDVFVGVAQGSIYRSTDLGISWNPVDSALSFTYGSRLKASATQLVAAYLAGVFRSTDKGTTWNRMGEGPSINAVSALAIDNQETVFAGTSSDGIYRWGTGDTAWTAVDSGLFDLEVLSLYVDSTVTPERIYAGMGTGLYVSTNNGTVWTLVGPTGGDVTAMTANADTLFASTGSLVQAMRGTGGAWSVVGRAAQASDYCVIGNHHVLAVGGGILHSSDDGSTWSQALDISASSSNGLALIRLDSLVFAATDTGVFVSSDSGSTWIPRDTGLEVPGNYWANGGLTPPCRAFLIASGTSLLAATGNGMYRTTDYGLTWTSADTGIGGVAVQALAADGNRLFAGTINGVFFSTNGGTQWTDISSNLSNKYVRTMAAAQGNIFVGTSTGVFSSTDIGGSWNSFNDGLMASWIRKLLINGGELYVAPQYSGIWHRPLPGGATAVQSDNPVPVAFSLSQNYPNPFNGIANIRFRMAQPSKVTLTIYDVLGRKVATLIDGVMEAGTHAVQWNSGSLPSGVYFYRLETGDKKVVETKQMVLVK